MTRGEANLISCRSSRRTGRGGDQQELRRSGDENEKSLEHVQSGDGVGQIVRSLAHFVLAADGGWFTSEDIQVGALNFGLTSKDVGVSGDWAGQRGGGS